MKRRSVSYITAMGLMIALVFIGSKISIPLPITVGTTPSRIHLGNIFCLLSGLIFGPVGGGLSAGIGSMLFDLTDPVYASSAVFTFVFKFIMGFACGKIAYIGANDAKNIRLNAFAGIMGIIIYAALYVGRSFITAITYHGMAFNAALIDAGLRALTSVVNGAIAVVIAVSLNIALREGLERASIFDKIRYEK
jgi:uncharacterized membrane protein